MELLLLILPSVAAVFALAVAGIALRFARRVSVLPNTVLETVNTFAAEMEGYRTKVIQWRGEIEAVLDQVDATLDRTETKRRSIAAKESRVTKVAEDLPTGQIDPMRMSRIELERLARTKGLMT